MEQPKFKIIGNVNSASVYNDRRKSGLYVSFLTDDLINLYDYIIVCNAEGGDVGEAFQVKEVSVVDGKFLVEAVEVGYWCHKRTQNPDFDLRTLFGQEVRLVLGKEWKQNINTRSCWC